MENEECQKALDAEWDRLRTMPWPDGKGRGTWDESKVEEAKTVRDRAKKKGETVHFSRICQLLYEKHSELDINDELRKMKGRAVLLGNNVFGQAFDWAEFQELSSSPPSMEAARCADALGLFAGYCQTQSDAISAYTQAFLRGAKTYVALPKERWPESWKGIPQPSRPAGAGAVWTSRRRGVLGGAVRQGCQRVRFPKLRR